MKDSEKMALSLARDAETTRVMEEQKELQKELDDGFFEQLNSRRIPLSIRLDDFKVEILRGLVEEYYSSIATMGADLMWVGMISFMEQLDIDVQARIQDAIKKVHAQEDEGGKA